MSIRIQLQLRAFLRKDAMRSCLYVCKIFSSSLPIYMRKSMVKLIAKSSLSFIALSSLIFTPIAAMAQRVDYRDPTLKNRIPTPVNQPSNQAINSNVPAIPKPQLQQISPQLASVLLAYGLQPAPECLPATVVILAHLNGQITQTCAYPNTNFQPGYYALDTNFKLTPINNPQQATQTPAVPVISGR